MWSARSARRRVWCGVMTARRFALAGLVAACGGGHTPFPNGVPDGPPPDTLPQSTGDAMVNAVTIAVTDVGMPVANASVYFQNPDSSLVSGLTTDAHGTASALVADDGFVTVIEPGDASGISKLVTFAGTRPGDVLHLDLGAT